MFKLILTGGVRTRIFIEEPKFTPEFLTFHVTRNRIKESTSLSLYSKPYLSLIKGWFNGDTSSVMGTCDCIEVNCEQIDNILKPMKLWEHISK